MKKSKLRDFDPESLLDPAPDSSDDENSASGSEEDIQAGREHYTDVLKSKLRKREVVPLGPQYEGSRISRDAAEDEDSDDPFARRFDVEDSEEGEDEAVGKIFNGNGSGIGYGEGNDEDEESLDENEKGFVDEDGASDEEMDSADQDSEDEDDVDEGEEDAESDSADETANRSTKLREMMKEQSNVTATISRAAKADVEKGQAVKAQRKAFDSLLNTRIRLQKALISTNSMSSETCSKTTASDSAISSAEAAALTLLNNLTNLRATLDSARTGQKRKRPAPFTSSSPSNKIWSSICSAEPPNLGHRKAVLEKWSTKTKGVSLSNSKGRLNTSAQQTLTDVLNFQLSDSTRLVKRTQIPRSCAPLQSAANAPPSEHIYDDAGFYGLLLKELLEQRSADLSTASGAEFIVQAPWQVAREAKTKKIVDTRASKGRKLRYTVHEKLQNFMAPEERGSWGDRQREELFGSLFGRRVGLGEEEQSDGEAGREGDEGIDVEEEGLMLFRS
ncbi:TRAUB-domain-containing protein [Lindgomyces ingoldianus]|uniref:TRAUB-domain-containing protein n=1 Tax=Lindgomyces ingoldianus TaxID=673940 RepID=A0ACB6QZW8_9PLEO|nr:TRAUB-domain-containing protein [Lindgomyces ingoldianus]KAF2472578.1 TRAUB-domain-containing protein [Lindgomyces ingoldianus]